MSVRRTPEDTYPVFFKTVRDLVKDEARFRDVMGKQDFPPFCTFLFSACKMRLLDDTSVILDVYHQKLEDMQVAGNLKTHIRLVIQSMLSVNMAVGDSPAVSPAYWESLFQTLALSIEQRVQEDPDWKLHLLPTSNLLSLMAAKQEFFEDSTLIDRIYNLVTIGKPNVEDGVTTATDQDSKTMNKLIAQMEKFRTPEQLNLLPNLASHIYISCAKLKVSDQAFWHDFDDLILSIFP